MNERMPKEGELWDLPGTHGWCRHGKVVMQMDGDNLTGVDTYWGRRVDGLTKDWYTVEEMQAKGATFIIDLNTARKVFREEFETYDDADRAYIPIGGSSEKYYIRKGAQPSIQRLIEQTESELRTALYKIESGTRDANRLTKELDALRASYEIPF